MMHAFTEFIIHFGLFAIIFVVFAESGLLFGFIFPGDSLLFVSGAAVQQGILPVNIHLFTGLLILAAVLGDSVGYTFGRRVGRELFKRKNSRLFKRAYLARAEQFYQKYGSLTVVLARFVPIVRTFAPIVAGASHMHYRTFLVFNIIGGIAWVTLFTYLGFFAGKALTDAGVNIEIVALLIILLSIAPIFIHWLKQPATRRAIKQQWSLFWRRKES